MCVIAQFDETSQHKASLKTQGKSLLLQSIKNALAKYSPSMIPCKAKSPVGSLSATIFSFRKVKRLKSFYDVTTYTCRYSISEY